jgi:tetratricopeptide (TPR) repeat protein
MIEIGMTVSDDRLKKNALSEALKYNPYGFHVRSKYLHTFTPRWGGSYQEMEDFCDEAKKYSAYNPELKSLRSQIFSDKAKVFESEQNNEEAVQYYSKALKYREFADYYAERGDCYYALEKYKLALNDYNKALDLKPNSPEYMRRKSGVLFRLNKLSDAQDLIEEASRLDPNNKWIQKKKDFYESDGVKAYKHSKQGLEYFQANRFQDAIRLNGDLSINYFSRGSCYIQLKRYDEALKDYKEVLVHQRDNLKAYDAIGWIQYHTGSIMMPSLLLILS